MKVELIYFKPSGKYYSSGDYETTRQHIFEIFEEVQDMADEGNLPGLMPGSFSFHILIGVPKHPQNYPHLLVKEY